MHGTPQLVQSVQYRCWKAGFSWLLLLLAMGSNAVETAKPHSSFASKHAAASASSGLSPLNYCTSPLSR